MLESEAEMTEISVQSSVLERKKSQFVLRKEDERMMRYDSYIMS